MIYPMIALVTLLAGGYRRSGFGRRVIVAVGGGGAAAGAALRGARRGCRRRAELWPLMYLPVLLGAVYVGGAHSCGSAGRAAPRARRGMTLWRYILRGFLRAVLARLRW